jgi:hypothetical protein
MTDSKAKITKANEVLELFQRNLRSLSELADAVALGEEGKRELLTTQTLGLEQQLSLLQGQKKDYIDKLKEADGALLRKRYEYWLGKATQKLGELCIMATDIGPASSLAEVEAAAKTYQALKDNGCTSQVPLLDKRLKKIVKLLHEEITYHQKAMLSGVDDDPKRVSQIREARQKIAKIKETTAVAEVEGELITTHADYPAFSISLYGGVESQTVNDLAKPDLPRLGLLVYQQARGKKRHSWHFYGNFLLTGSAEATQHSDIEEADQVLETNLNVFYAYDRVDLDSKYALWGPVISIGALKADGALQIAKKRYIGLRSAINPETYTEILYGKTSGLDSQRLELRLQAPVSRFDNGTRIFLGAVYNVAVDKRVEDEADTVRAYIAWHIPFGDVWNRGDGG